MENNLEKLQFKSGYWESEKGNKSNTRKDASLVIYFAMLMSFSTLIIGALDTTAGLIAVAASAGTLFLTIAGSAMVYSFGQKGRENKSDSK